MSGRKSEESGIDFASQRRACNAAENKGCSQGSESDTRLCVRPLHTERPVFIASVCGKKMCRSQKCSATLCLGTHIKTHAHARMHTHTANCTHTRAHTPPFFLLYSNILIFQSGTVASSLCTTVIICLPFFSFCSLPPRRNAASLTEKWL